MELNKKPWKSVFDVQRNESMWLNWQWNLYNVLGIQWNKMFGFSHAQKPKIYIMGYISLKIDGN